MQNMNAVLDDAINDIAYEKFIRGIDRKGLENLVLKNCPDRWDDEMRRIFVNQGPAVQYQKKGTVKVDPETANKLIESYARMGGFVKQIAEDKVLNRLFFRIPLNYTEWWLINQRFGSPKAFISHLNAVNERTRKIINGAGFEPSRRALAVASLSHRKVGKAAVIAAQMTVAQEDVAMSYRDAREGLTNFFLYNQGAARVVKRLVRTTKTSRVLAISKELAESITPEEAQILLPKRGKILKQWRALSAVVGYHERPHAWRALVNIHIALPTMAQRLIDMTNSGQMTVHSAGINLNRRPLPKEAEAWLFKGSHWSDRVSVVNVWADLLHRGWQPDSKDSVHTAKQLMAQFQYKCVKNIAFASEAAKWGVTEWEFVNFQDSWLDLKKYETIPAPNGIKGLMHGEYRLYQLAHDDPRALFAGEHTGCCQHPRGAGKTSAWHAHESPDGAIWVVECRGRIVAQSWVWRDKSTLCLDNVEAGVVMQNETALNSVKSLLIDAAKSVVGVLGIEQIFLGTGYSTIALDQPRIKNQASAPFGCYTDADYVWRLA